MVKKIVLTAILAIALVLGMTVVGCGGGGGDAVPIIPVPQMVSYQSADTAGYTYILVITVNGYTVAAGDSYVLTITKSGQSDKKSTGTVSVVSAGGTLTLKPANAPTSFTVNTSGTQITAFSGPITLDDGETLEAGEFNGGNNNNNGNNSDGGTFTLTGIPSEYNGKYVCFFGGNDSYFIGEDNKEIVVWGYKTVNTSTYTLTLPVISNGSVSIPLWITTSSGNSMRYSGNHTLYVEIIIRDLQSVTFEELLDDGSDNNVALLIFSSVAFSNGSATKSSSQGNIETYGNNNNFTYTEDGYGSITITGYTGTADSVYIPSQINRKPVSSIGESAFAGCASLTSVTILCHIYKIGDESFDGCKNLTSVTFSIGSDIEREAFGNNVFPEGSAGAGGNTLKNAYSTGKKSGTYTRAANGSTWTKTSN